VVGAMSPIGTLRHFAAMQDLVAIGAKRTSIKPHQSSSIYEYEPFMRARPGTLFRASIHRSRLCNTGPPAFAEDDRLHLPNALSPHTVSANTDLILRSIAQAMRLEGWMQAAVLAAILRDACFASSSG